MFELTQTEDSAVLSPDVVGLGGIALSILGLVLAIYYGRKSIHATKRELTWSVETIPIFGRHIERYRGAVHVTVGEREIENPHIVRFWVKNTGRLDIESSMFDQGRPIIFRLSQTKYTHLIEEGGPPVDAAHNTLKLGPELLPSGKSWIVSVISEGKPEATLESHLANVKIRGGVNQPDVRAAPEYRGLVVTLSLLLYLVIFGGGYLIYVDIFSR